jgi:hypothetical protein
MRIADFCRNVVCLLEIAPTWNTALVDKCPENLICRIA